LRTQSEQRAAERREDRHAAGVGIGVLRIHQPQTAPAPGRLVLVFDLAVHDDHVAWHLAQRHDASALELGVELRAGRRTVGVRQDLQELRAVFRSNDDGGS
jgi:hypothetical protein